MQSLTITNNITNETVTLGYDADPYLVQNIIGISNAPVSLLTTKGFQQDGTTAAGEFLAARLVSFSVIVFGTGMADIYEKRRSLIKLLNPKHDCTVIYANDYISKKFDCRVSGPPKFLSAQQNDAGAEQTAVISLRADNPFLFDLTDTTNQLAVVTGAFEFPLEFDPDIEFGTLANKQITITNDGDVETPVKIQFSGPSTNPIVTNVTTGEFIKVIKVIAADEILEINTAYGENTVEIIDSLGDRTNAFQFIDTDSIFWKLQVGDNVINYDADSGADSATVLIIHSQRFVGV